MNIQFQNISFLFLLIVLPLFGYSQVNDTIQHVNAPLCKVDSIQGNIVTINMYSHFLDEERSITVYKPPQSGRAVEYGVLIVTDEMAKNLAEYVEYLILNDIIEPIVVVGINHRKKQTGDSLIAQYGFDIRAQEFHKTSEIFSEIPIADSLVPICIKNRYYRFVSFVKSEVIMYVKEHYSLSNNRDKWTIGGYSNGAGFAVTITQDYPNLFGNAIVLSLAVMSLPYNFTNKSPKYYFAVGNKEVFLKTSIYYAKQLGGKRIPYVHYTYDAGHDYNMWIDAYIKFIKQIYKKE